MLYLAVGYLQLVWALCLVFLPKKENPKQMLWVLKLYFIKKLFFNQNDFF